MATKQITTWAEFKTAYRATRTEATTLNITTDLDASDDILDSSLVAGSGSYRLTIQGNGHKINGLSSYNNIYLIMGGSYIKFYNVHFSNIFCPTGGFTYGYGSSGNFYLFTECYFNGLVNIFCSGYSSSRYAAFNKCSFNIKMQYFTDIGWCWYLNECYCIFNPKTKGGICIPMNPSAGSLFSNVLIGQEIATANNNYFAGTLRHSSTSGIAYYFGGYFGDTGGLLLSNVYNCEVHTPVGVDEWYFHVQNTDATSVQSLYNKEKCFAGETTTVKLPASNANVVGITDSGLKSASTIHSQAPRFPLYGY